MNLFTTQMALCESQGKALRLSMKLMGSRGAVDIHCPLELYCTLLRFHDFICTLPITQYISETHISSKRSSFPHTRQCGSMILKTALATQHNLNINYG